MRGPNSELFRIVRFAIRFRGWHTFGADVRPHLKRAEALGFLEVSWQTKQFRLLPPESPEPKSEYELGYMQGRGAS